MYRGRVIKTRKKYPDEYIAYLHDYKKNLREDIIYTPGINTEDPVIQQILSYLE